MIAPALPKRNYGTNTNRMLTPDSIVPQFTDPQSLNRFSYARNNPINRIDPSGHVDCGLLGDTNDVAGCNAGPQSIPENIYGIQFTADNGEAWSLSQMQIVLQAAADIESYLREVGDYDGYAPGEVWQAVYGTMTMHRSAEDRSYGGETFAHKIEFYDPAFTVNSKALLYNVVHEFGHAFNAITVITTNNSLKLNPYNDLANTTIATDAGHVVGYNPDIQAFMGTDLGFEPYPSRQARGDQRNLPREQFADMFLQAVIW